MYSKLRRKLVFTVAYIIIPMVVLSFLAQGTRADWYLKDTKAETYHARGGLTLIPDGVEDATWSSTEEFLETDGNPNLEFHMKFNSTSSLAYCLIIVKNYSHSANESVLLILSNNGTTLTKDNPDLFKDAKYADINNKTEDRRLVAGNYKTVDEDQNITGKMSFQFKEGLTNHSVYEFGFKFNNTDPGLDTVWTFGQTYAAKIQVQDEVAGWVIDDYPLFGIEFGLAGGEPNETLSPFDLDVKLLTWIAFIGVGGIYGIIGVYVIVSRSKGIVVPKGRAPEELEEETEPSSDAAEVEQEETEESEED